MGPAVDTLLLSAEFVRAPHSSSAVCYQRDICVVGVVPRFRSPEREWRGARADRPRAPPLDAKMTQDASDQSPGLDERDQLETTPAAGHARRRSRPDVAKRAPQGHTAAQTTRRSRPCRACCIRWSRDHLETLQAEPPASTSGTPIEPIPATRNRANPPLLHQLYDDHRSHPRAVVYGALCRAHYL
jgi:hypothetical protein